MQPTHLKYMDHQYLYEDTATVLDVRRQEDGRTCVFLDSTIFYPQGGGQLYDQGTITTANGAFKVEEVRFIDGVVHHMGAVSGEIGKDDAASLNVDAARRELHMRLHSAGHLIDEAVGSLGYGWAATKGCHFPGQCFVEYTGVLPPEGEACAARIEEAANRMVSSGYQTRVMFAERERLDELCHFTLPNMPTDKPTRVAFIWGEKGVPCGGTHVKDIADIGRILIRKVKEKKGVIKVSYEIA